VLVSLGGEIININLSLGDLREILSSIHTASSSYQIQKISIGGLTVETDGRPQKKPLLFSDGGLFDWPWSPNAVASASKPSTDYVWIDITRLLERIYIAIDRRKIEQVYGELANLRVQITPDPA
jgi:hypothetical protein